MILNRYANTLTSAILQAIVVSPETQKVGDHINSVRSSSSLLPLSVIPIQYIPPPSSLTSPSSLSSSSSSNSQLSSTMLRELMLKQQNNTIKQSYLYFLLFSPQYIFLDFLLGSGRTEINQNKLFVENFLFYPLV